MFGLLFSTAQAQEISLVSNITESHTGLQNVFPPDYTIGTIELGEKRNAQRFTTGSNPAGYTLQSVVLNLLEGSGTGQVVRVAIHDDGSSGNPGTLLAVLDNPADPIGNNSGTAGNRTFAAPSALSLNADTEYWVVVSNTTTANSYFDISVTNSNNETTAHGFSIRDSRHEGTPGSWLEDNNTKLRMEVRGTVVIPTGLEVTLHLSDDEPLEDLLAVKVTATASPASPVAFTVEISASPVAPATDDDFELSANRTLSFAANATGSAGTVRISPVADEAPEPNDVVTVSGVVSNPAIPNPDDVRLTILNDDADLPQDIAIDAPAAVDEGAGTANVTVTLTTLQNTAPVIDAQLFYRQRPETATRGADYTRPQSLGNRIAIVPVSEFSANAAGTAWVARHSFEIGIVDDGEAEADETIVFEIYNIGDNRGTGQTIVIRDDDRPTAVSIAAANPTVLEEQPAVFTLSRTGATGSALTVTVALTEQADRDVLPDGAATERMVTFARGSSTAALTVELKDDSLAEPDGDLTAAVQAGDGYTVGDPSTATVTVVDDDGVPVIERIRVVSTPRLVSRGGSTPDTYGEGENIRIGVRFNQRVHVEGEPTFALEVGDPCGSVCEARYESGGGTDTLVFAYLVLDVDIDRNGIAIPANPIEVVYGDSIRSDTDHEANLSYRREGTQSSHKVDGSRAAGPYLSVEDAEAHEADRKMDFTVRLEPHGLGIVTVEYATRDGSARAGEDYTETSGTLRFNSLEMERTVTVPIMDDAHQDDGETFTLRLSNPDGAELRAGEREATGTIHNSDPPAVSVSDASATEGDAIEFTVSLSAASGRQVTVQYATSDGTAESGTDFTAASGTLTFEPNETSKTVSVPTTGDSEEEEDETFALTLSNPADATLGDATATGTIVDDDESPPLTVSMTSDLPPPVESAFAVRFSFSEPVRGFTGGDIETRQEPACTDSANNPVSCNPTMAAFETTDDRIFTTTVTPRTDQVAHNYTLTFTVPAGRVTSAAGNKPNEEATLEVRVAPPGVTVPISSIGLTANPGNSQVTLRWSTPDNSGGSAIVRYEYRWRESVGVFGDWVRVDPSERSATAPNLTNGREYVFQVRGVNALGYGPVETASATPAEATPEAPEVFTLDFAHFANGTGITSEMVLVNVSPHPIRPAIYFYDRGGHLIDPASVVDVTVDLEVTEDGSLSVLTEMEPLGELTISTHGRGELVSGSVKVVSDSPIGGGVRYGVPEIGVAGVGASQPVRDALFPARRQEGGIRTAAALHNLGEEAVGVNCRLMSGGVSLEEVEIPLEANGQASWFIEDVFTTTDTSDFVGSVRCTVLGSRRFTAIAVEMDDAQRIFNTLSVVPLDRTGGGNEQTTLNFAHFVNGTWITDLVFVNLSTEASRPAPTPFHTDILPSRPAIYFYDTEGNPIAAESVVDITGDLEITEDGALTVQSEMEPLGVLTISTHGRGELVSGSARVVSEGPIAGMLRFEHPDFGVAGVEASPPLSDALFPVRRQEGGINTGVALHNLESSPGLLRCDLMREGVLLDAASIPLEANGQTSWLIDQAFPAADTSDFAGSVRCDAVGEDLFSAVALEMDPGNRIFTTLPVVPVPEMPDRE